MLNGVDIREFDVDELRTLTELSPRIRRYSTIPSGRTQVRRIDATEEQIVEVVEKSRLMPLIRKLPQGYDTIVGERGLMISGVKAKAGHCRVLLKGADIMFFDEATSALDTHRQSRLY